MSLPKINLDDRTFNDLMKEALDRVRKACPEWTDISSPGDPGRMMVELFAFLTETMIYRLNRLPEKVYVELLRLMGVNLRPPSAAYAKVVFSIPKPKEKNIEIQRGIRVASSVPSPGGVPPTFTLLETAVIKAGETEVECLMYHGELVEGEQPDRAANGSILKVIRPPIVAPFTGNGGERTLVVTVEVSDDDRNPLDEFEIVGGKKYRVWREVESFPEAGAYPYVFVADRLQGTIVLSPSMNIPQSRDVRVWYVRGGGSDGNVREHTLTVLKDPLGRENLSVDNPDPASGGMDSESLEKALIRGPKEFRSLERVVTAGDYELVALGHPSVGRAWAYTKKAHWEYARPGTVELLLVPRVPLDLWEKSRLTSEMIRKNQTVESLREVLNQIRSRQPIGIDCSIGWVKYKEVTVKAKVVVNHGEDLSSIRDRIVNRLNLSIGPLPTAVQPEGWKFSDPLRVSQVFKILLDEPGVRFAENVVLKVDKAPDTIISLATDPFQKKTWYAVTRDFVFRSTNDTDGWEQIGLFDGESIKLIKSHPERPGILALLSLNANNKEYIVRISTDSGETWESSLIFKFEVEDMAWSNRDDQPLLHLASDEGLFEVLIRKLPISEALVPTKISVNPQDANQGYYAIAAANDLQGNSYVALASQKSQGIFLSSLGGKSETFKNIGQIGKDIRTLAIHRDDAGLYLWGGVTVPGNQKGTGAVRWKLQGANTIIDGQPFSKNWNGGSCMSISFFGDHIYAGSFNAGILVLDASKAENEWTEGAVNLNCGLPIREADRLFVPVVALAARPSSHQLDSAPAFHLLAGGERGVFKRAIDSNKSITYKLCSPAVFSDKVTIPDGWLFCPGEHEIQVDYQ